MALIVHVVSGPSAGRTLRLSEGQSAIAGRRAPAELLLEDDPAVSSSHLGISWRDGRWQVRDLDSTNGTWRGHNAVTELVLRGGEELRVGDCVLRFSVESVAPRPALAPPPRPAPAPPPRPAPAPPPRPAPAAPLRPAAAPAAPRAARAGDSPPEPIPCSSAPCNSGLVLLRPLEAERSAADAARCMAAAGSVHLLIDAGVLESDDELMASPPLFDWLEEEAARAVAPRLLSNSEPAPLCERFVALLGQDACVLLLAAAPAEALAAALRSAFRPAEASGGVAALWQPRNAWMLLAHIDPETAQRLLPGVDAILLEDAEGESWRVLCRPGALPALAAAGLPAPRPGDA